ncbi:MAG: hypothetical protein ACXU82_11480 [Caulobacteraceae bacterium]
MESATFRRWLEERGCRFQVHESARGHGHGTVTVMRDGRSAHMPMVGSQKALDFATEQAICEALALDWSELPGVQRQP